MSGTAVHDEAHSLFGNFGNAPKMRVSISCHTSHIIWYLSYNVAALLISVFYFIVIYLFLAVGGAGAGAVCRHGVHLQLPRTEVAERL
jgi:hypothetical protein